MRLPIWGLILQGFYLLSISVFSFIRIYFINHFTVYPVAFFEFSIGSLSVLCGIYGIIKRVYPILSIFISLFGLIICAFLMFVYFLPEGDFPAPIPLFFK